MALPGASDLSCRENTMAFIHPSAPHGQRVGFQLSADSCPPERALIVETLRTAAPLLGLKPPVLATLEVLLYCLPPRRNHNMVFASNSTLTFRRSGITDRTLRRHITLLEELGFLVRNDSPNGKRYTRSDGRSGQVLRFGFDLSPLLDQFESISQIAAQAIEAERHMSFLRLKLRSAIQHALNKDDGDPVATEALRALRRKSSPAEIEALLAALPEVTTQMQSLSESSDPEAKLSATDSQNVRHHHKSNQEHLEKEPSTKRAPSPEKSKKPRVTVHDLLTACPSAMEFAISEVRTTDDVVHHAQVLAPMMGIDRQSYQAAEQRLGEVRTAVTIWGLLQMQDRIKSMGGYFRAITTGQRSDGFDPWALISSLSGRRAARSAG